MTIEEAVKTRMEAFTGLTDLVVLRLYPLLLPQAPTYPALTYGIVSGVPVSAMGSDTGVTRKRLSVTSWGGTSYAAAKRLSEQVRLCFERWRGTVGGLVIQDTYVLNAGVDLFDDIARVYYVVSDFEIVHQE